MTDAARDGTVAPAIPVVESVAPSAPAPAALAAPPRLELRVRRVPGVSVVAVRVLLRGGARAEPHPAVSWAAGRLLTEGLPGDVQTHPEVVAAYLGEEDPEAEREAEKLEAGLEEATA